VKGKNQASNGSAIGKGPDQDVCADGPVPHLFVERGSRGLSVFADKAQSLPSVKCQPYGGRNRHGTKRPRQRHEAFLVYPSEYPQEPVYFVDGIDSRCGAGASTDPQAAGRDQGKARPCDRIAYIARDTLASAMLDSLRQPLCLGKSDLFLNTAGGGPASGGR